MEQVCVDYNNTVWRFDKDTDIYSKFSSQGKLLNYIKGEYLPDPAIIAMKRVNSERTQASPATKALWSHHVNLNN